MKARVVVVLKSDVLDPQGEAIRKACASLGHAGVRDVRQGKLFEISVDAPDAASARRMLESLADQLLANPVIEDWRIEAIEA
jgi:phosphoribosylformylglycinamidine synthase